MHKKESRWKQQCRGGNSKCRQYSKINTICNSSHAENTSNILLCHINFRQRDMNILCFIKLYLLYTCHSPVFSFFIPDSRFRMQHFPHRCLKVYTAIIWSVLHKARQQTDLLHLTAHHLTLPSVWLHQEEQNIVSETMPQLLEWVDSKGF
jgi:hypothetical protein